MDTPPAHLPLPDLVCFSHLRWNFVYQRPQHLMSRFARVRRVVFVEEPEFEQTAEPYLRVSSPRAGLEVVVPILDESVGAREAIAVQRALLTEYIGRGCASSPTFWFQTPMALPIAPTELAGVVIYDCMDELSAFHQAPLSLIFNEKQLLSRADLVFTGGRALYEAKRTKHRSVHCFPSAIDDKHFAGARAHAHGSRCLPEIGDLPPGARIGFCGVIDERLDAELLDAVAALRPEYQFVMVGPTVKIDPDALPRRDNIHYLGMREYDDLPLLMAEWDAAIMPFARNDATRYISPTKTPEYLAAGLPVVSTGIRDVVRQYGDQGLVAIAGEAGAFADAIDAALPTRDDPARLRAVDTALQQISWETTWARMAALERSAARATTVSEGGRVEHADAR
jgi:UDP-galactopyranose mutase